MKILLAIDGSLHSRYLVKVFARRLFPVKTKVRIITAFEKSIYMRSLASMGVMTDFKELTDTHSGKIAELAVKDAFTILHNKNPELQISTAAIEGSPKQVILKEAEKMGADLIIVGSHGHGVAARFLLGSVSQAIVLHAKCSVEIIRKKKFK